MSILIAYLLGIMSAILPSNVKHKNEDSKSGEPDSSTNFKRISTEVNLSKREAERYYTEQDKSYSLQRATFRVNFATLLALAFYTVFTYRILCATQKSAKAAISAADTAHDSLVLANRPWVKIKHRIISPLSFDFVGAAGPAATMTIEDTLENVGNSVALNVFVWEEIIPRDADMSINTAYKKREEVCNRIKTFDLKSEANLNGYVLFPRDPLVQPEGIGITMPEVSKAVEANKKKLKPTSRVWGKIEFVIVGCVGYRSSFDPDGTRPHVTGFWYELGQISNGGWFGFVSPTGTANNLQLIKSADRDFAY